MMNTRSFGMTGWITFTLLAWAGTLEAQADTARLDLEIQADQARATIDILTHRAAGLAVTDSLWDALDRAEGYRRVMERERGMDERFGLDRGIDEASFREWAGTGAALDGLEGQRIALAAWDSVDTGRAGALALAYLPPDARLRATVYPIVREQTNSFIWDAETDPAIFMYVEPGKTAAMLEHTLAHELHHIGAAGACPDPQADLTPGERQAVRWLGAFAEGLAVLAAAGGPDGATHPHDPPDIRRAWAARMDRVAPDMVDLESFFLDLLDGRTEGDAAGRRGMAFINRPGAPQGPFYSVGWHMAAAVERDLGRDAVIRAVCDPVRLLLDYQGAAARLDLPRWSSGFIDRLRPLASLH